MPAYRTELDEMRLLCPKCSRPRWHKFFSKPRRLFKRVSAWSSFAIATYQCACCGYRDRFTSNFVTSARKPKG